MELQRRRRPAGRHARNGSFHLLAGLPEPSAAGTSHRSRAKCPGCRSTRASRRKRRGASAIRAANCWTACASLYGGIEAERLLLGDVTSGASGFGHPNSDLSRATEIAKLIIEVCGMGGQTTGLRVFRDAKGERDILSGMTAEAIDRQVSTLVVEAQARAAAILAEHKEMLIRLRDELQEKKTIEGDRVKTIIEEFKDSAKG